jgi:hypothetical protein
VSEMMERMLELMKSIKPLPRETLHVERLGMLDSIPKIAPERPPAAWAGFPVVVDATLPRGVWELRDEAGTVLATNARPTEPAR